MGKAGRKMLAGAREALAVARGEEVAARVAMMAWAVMLPGGVLTLNLCGDRNAAWQEAANMVGNQGVACAKRTGFRVVRVRVSTVTNGDRE
jgi:hypothetical protein